MLRNLTDDCVFSVCMKNKNFSKIVLELILDIDIMELEYVDVQKAIMSSPEYKDVRLDVFIKDINGKLYNVEMQREDSDNIRKRARFYQGVMDVSTLLKGSKYKELPESYVIFLTDFDLFGKGRCVYTFKNRCVEVDDLYLGDMTTKMFLNLKGNEFSGTSKRLINLLTYIKDPTYESAGIDPKLRELNEIYNRYVETEEFKMELNNWSCAEQVGFDKGVNASVVRYICNQREVNVPDNVILKEAVRIFDVSPERAERLMNSSDTHKLQWCRQHAPEVYKHLSDEELLEKMDDAYRKENP